MSLEFGTRHCGMRCPYCYVRGNHTRPPSRRAAREPLSVAELVAVMDQALELGLGGVGIIGPYEPLQEPGIMDLVVALCARDLRVTIFTKGQCLTKELAASLGRNEVTVGVTVHSLRGEIHDELTGKTGSLKTALEAVQTLLKNGYDGKRRQILIQSVAVRPNLADLPEVWRWARRNGFVPFFERMTVQGAARTNVAELSIPPHELRRLSQHISRIDRAEFGREWAPHPPWIGESCARHLNSCHLTVDGYIQPCTGVDIPIGNVRDTRLSTLLRNSSVIRDLRNIRETIKGACRDCPYADICYGCRGQAYQLTGNYLAADPCCWKNPERCSGVCGIQDACGGEALQEHLALRGASSVTTPGTDLRFPEAVAGNS